MQAVPRKSTTGRLFRYACGNYINRGAAVCSNARMASMDVADAAVRELLAREVLRPAVLEHALDRALAMLARTSDEGDRKRHRATIRKRLQTLDVELANLADTAARCGAVPAVLQGLAEKDGERRRLVDELQALGETAVAPHINAAALRQELRGYVDDWQALTRAHVTETRPLIETVLRSRIVFTPIENADGVQYQLRVPIAFERLLVALVPSLAGGLNRVGGTSPTGTADGWQLPVSGFPDLAA
jgi:hypothetical protein